MQASVGIGVRCGVHSAVAIGLVAVVGCSRAPTGDAPATARIRLWHTFNPAETAALNEILAARPRPHRVETTLLPFQRGQTILREVIERGDECPDLVRMDATWIPELARAGVLAAVPADIVAARPWLPEGADLARDRGVDYALPQSIDGLALIYREDAVRGVDWPPRTVNELIATATRLTEGGNHGLGVRVDGYWFAAFLRGWGGELLDPDTGYLGIDRPLAKASLDRFAAFFAARGIAGLPPPSGNEAQDEVRRFRAGAIAVVMNGPWAVTDLAAGDMTGLGVAPFPSDPSGRPAAPRGGQMFVVPTCARDPAAAWALALELTAPELQASWAKRFGVVPTTTAALAGAGPLSQAFYRALERARPLPRHPISAEIFDDLNPAIAAVVAGDATAAEALDGAVRAWTRLLARHGLQANTPPAPDAGVGPP